MLSRSGERLFASDEAGDFNFPEKTMRMKQADRAKKRLRERAAQFLKALGEELAHQEQKAELTRLEEVGLGLTARNLAEDFNLPADIKTIHQIVQWLKQGTPKIEELEKIIVLVPLFWDKTTRIDSKGQVLSPMPHEIAQLSDFIRPGHIYLDVTFATLNDVAAIWGERKSIKEMRAEVERKIPHAVKVNFEYVKEQLAERNDRTPMEQVTSRLLAKSHLEVIGIKVEEINEHTDEELRELWEAHFRKRLEQNPSSMWEPKLSKPPKVAEIQDYAEVARMVQAKVKPGGHRGRGRGQQRPQWAKWRKRANEIGYDVAKKQFLAEVRHKWVENRPEFEKWMNSKDYKEAKRAFERNVKKRESS